MVCQCCKYFHKTTAMAIVDGQLQLTVTNSGGVESLDNFVMVVCQNPNKVSTTAIPVVVNVNGTNVPVYTKYSTPLSSSMLGFYTHKLLRGYYIVNGGSAYVIFPNIPYNNYCGCCNAQNATTTVTTNSDNNGNNG